MLLCSLTACGDEKKQNNEAVTFPVDTSNLEKNEITPHTVDFAAFTLDDDGNVYAVSGEKITKFSLEGEFIDEYPDTEGFSTLYYDGGYVYASTEDMRIVRLDTETKEIAELAKDFAGSSIMDIAVSDGTLFVTSFGWDDDQQRIEDRLWRIDLDGGKPSKLDTKSIDAIYAAGDKSSLYAYSSYYSTLYKLNGDTFKIVKKFGMDIYASAFIVESGYFCYAGRYNGETQLLKINLNSDDPEPERIVPEGVYLSSMISEVSLRYQKGNIYYVDKDKETFASVFLEPAPEKVEVKPKGSDPKKLVVCGWNIYSPIKDSVLSAAAKESELNGKYVCNYEPELKILAGDSDVDIYIVTAWFVNKMLEKGIYLPIESDIVTEFNAGCFDYIDEMTKDKSGKTIAMPIYDYTGFVAYPVQAAEELGFTREDITYYDDFQSVVESRTARKTYIYGTMTLYYDLEMQYDEYYNDFANKKADYNTELFRHIYSHLDGWGNGYYGIPAPKGYHHYGELGSYGEKKMFNKEKTLFTVNVRYDDLISATVTNPFLMGDDIPEFDLNDWRAIHMPWISEKVDKDISSVYYAIINPYSKHYDEAVKMLEYVTQNYFDSVNKYVCEYPMIRKDIGEYPERYLTESQVFKDVYEICQNGYLTKYLLPDLRNDINDFQSGRLTMDEAIAERQRQVDIWLNE